METAIKIILGLSFAVGVYLILRYIIYLANKDAKKMNRKKLTWEEYCRVMASD
jgi:hypothetical protein